MCNIHIPFARIYALNYEYANFSLLISEVFFPSITVSEMQLSDKMQLDNV